MSSNPNKIISLQELINAQVDAYKLELIMNEAPWVEIQTRLGRKCYSIATISDIIEKFQLNTQTALTDLQDAIAQIVEGGVPDLAVSTFSGRTQEQENKDFVTSVYDYTELSALHAGDGRIAYVKKDGICGEFVYSSSTETVNDITVIASNVGGVWKRIYNGRLRISWCGAVGDGISNDTQNIARFEQNFSDKQIDLLGGSYIVDSLPTLNKYTNGLFITNNRRVDLTSLSVADKSALLKEASSKTTIKYFHSTTKPYSILDNIKPWQLDMHGENTEELPVMSRITLKQAAEKHKKTVVLNANAFRNADNSSGWGNDLLVPNGVYIVDSTVITDWSYATNPTRNQAMCMMIDGTLKRFYKEEHTAQEMVDSGAIFGFSWGAWCVYDGAVPDDFANSPFGTSEVSARTVIMQKADGTIMFLMSEGVTGTSGMTGMECADIAIQSGAVRAYICEGGGSTQCWWSDCYAVPSSDETARTLPSYFTIDTDVDIFDTGFIEVPLLEPAVSGTPLNTKKPKSYLRQIGAYIHYNVNLSYTPNSNSFQLTNTSSIPKRFLPEHASLCRGYEYGGAGGIFAYFMDGGANLGRISVAVTNMDAPPTTIPIQKSWQQPKSN